MSAAEPAKGRAEEMRAGLGTELVEQDRVGSHGEQIYSESVGSSVECGTH